MTTDNLTVITKEEYEMLTLEGKGGLVAVQYTDNGPVYYKHTGVNGDAVLAAAVSTQRDAEMQQKRDFLRGPL